MNGRIAVAALHAISGAALHGGVAAGRGAKRSQIIKAGLTGAISHGVGGYAGASLGGSAFRGARSAGFGRVVSAASGLYTYGGASGLATPLAYLGVTGAGKLATKVAKSRPVKAVINKAASLRQRALAAAATKKRLGIKPKRA